MGREEWRAHLQTRLIKRRQPLERGCPKQSSTGKSSSTVPGAVPDPAFNELRTEMVHFVEAAWTAYDAKRKSPNTRKAGDDFADPSYELSVDWIAAREAILSAQQEHDDPDGPSRLLLINASPRNDHTCPREISKTWRLIQLAKRIFEEAAFDVEELDLSRVTAECGRNIHPCKACFSTAAPLCHWPCSCYPNYSLGQTQDWMNDIYPAWVRAHGVMIITSVHWYQVTTPLKLMMDRLVCADGGIPIRPLQRERTQQGETDRIGGMGLSPAHGRSLVFGRRPR